ncbi:hypothetical protein [Campylobacter geochelonis]|uniref:hypothetical protein n=1 Tax=Campylobacter geochelonis TaxID=1780362 RepID=UPI000A703BE7|nr:hypothetical protein [Campylobacter geochelonis]QKF71898.1 hypothetical protein CGEO_1622 [Campylobacter geochelonis]
MQDISFKNQILLSLFALKSCKFTTAKWLNSVAFKSGIFFKNLNLATFYNGKSHAR